MPAFSTHYIFAKELERQTAESCGFELNAQAMYIGAQGPDIFFFHRALPHMIGLPLRKIGSAMHRAKPAEILQYMREYITTSEEPDIAKSYAAGFIMHYALDRKCHPYVYYMQNKITQKHPATNPHTAHNRVEYAMDSYLLHTRLKIENPQKFNPAKTLDFDSATLDEVGKMISCAAQKTTGKRVTSEQAKTAVKDLKYIQALTFDPTGAKRALITAGDIIIAPFSKNFKFSAMLRPKDLEKAKKYGNIDKKRWRSPYGAAEQSDSFEELFCAAKDDAALMINQFFAGDDCERITQNISFLTGAETK